MLRILPTLPAVPYVSVGLGFANFSSSDTLAGGSPNSGSTGSFTGAAGIGGGVDVKIAPTVGIRFEVRSIRSGKPSFNLETSDGHSSLVVSGGIVLRL
jgi:opacity protein-like surface antigen